MGWNHQLVNFGGVYVGSTPPPGWPGCENPHHHQEFHDIFRFRNPIVKPSFCYCHPGWVGGRSKVLWPRKFVILNGSFLKTPFCEQWTKNIQHVLEIGGNLGHWIKRVHKWGHSGKKTSYKTRCLDVSKRLGSVGYNPNKNPFTSKLYLGNLWNKSLTWMFWPFWVGFP